MESGGVAPVDRDGLDVVWGELWGQGSLGAGGGGGVSGGGLLVGGLLGAGVEFGEDREPIAAGGEEPGAGAVGSEGDGEGAELVVVGGAEREREGGAVGGFGVERGFDGAKAEGDDLVRGEGFFEGLAEGGAFGFEGGLEFGGV